MLSDLDELVLTCNDPRARAYIQEAVNCYRAGAYRASIISAWIALAFDLIDKIRLLANEGDAEAVLQISFFDKARSNNDISSSLLFEKNLIDLCESKFQFFTPTEAMDLRRLTEDRNRCAHTSMQDDVTIFTPAPELARLHITTAIKASLSQPATRGKAALDGLFKLIEATSFPKKLEGISTILENSSLQKARPALVQNFAKVLLKEVFKPELKHDKRERNLNVISILEKMHPETASATISAFFKGLLSSGEDINIQRYISSCHTSQRWRNLGQPIKILITSYIENLPAVDIDLLEGMKADEFESAVNSRAARASFKSISEALWFSIPNALCNRLLDLYGKTDTYEEANTIGEYLARNASDFSEAHFERILVLSKANEEIAGSFGFPRLVARFESRSATWRTFVQQKIQQHKIKL